MTIPGSTSSTAGYCAKNYKIKLFTDPDIDVSIKNSLSGSIAYVHESGTGILVVKLGLTTLLSIRCSLNITGHIKGDQLNMTVFFSRYQKNTVRTEQKQ